MPYDLCHQIIYTHIIVKVDFMYFILDAHFLYFFHLMKPLSLYKIGCLNYNVRYVENDLVVPEIFIFLLPKSKGTAVFQQFQTAIIYKFFGSSLAVKTLPFCKLVFCIKAFQWQFFSIPTSLTVNRAEICMSSLKKNSFL